MATVSTATINPLYHKRQQIEGKLLPVANLVTMPSVYMAHPKMGVNNFNDFLAKIKAQPGTYSAGVPGLGTLGHLMVASFNETMKTQIQIVPYRGNGPALNERPCRHGPDHDRPVALGNATDQGWQAAACGDRLTWPLARAAQCSDLQGAGLRQNSTNWASAGSVWSSPATHRPPS
jgi:hypothetical protein